MKETPFFFDIRGSLRFAVLHAALDRAKGAFLFCHPFIEEKLWAHRVCVSFARTLARHGYAVLRMDLRGNGDSDGEFGEASLEDYIEDLEHGWRELLRREPHGDLRGVFGLRLGGTLALELTRRNSEINTLLLWEPILDTARYLRELLRSNLAGQMAAKGRVALNRETLVERMRQGEPIDIEGYAFTAKVYDSLDTFSLARECPPAVKRALLVQVSKVAEQPLRSEYGEWAKQWAGASAKSAAEEQFWREIKTFCGSSPALESVSLDWLEGQP